MRAPLSCSMLPRRGSAPGWPRWARNQTGVAPDKIFVIGWSYGAGGVLAALTAMDSEPPVLTKAVMYYPDCRRAMPWPSAGVSALMLMGAIDEVARPALCDAVIKAAPPNTLRAILSTRGSFR